MHHLRYSGLPFEEQRAAFLAIVASDPLLSETLARVRALALPDWLVVSGALYNSVWNHLTGKPPGYGIKDVDLFYFDDADLSYEAEDAVIRRAAKQLQGLALPVEVRNQARVHLWYPAKFGRECPRYTSASESVSYFASKTHAVGVRFNDAGFGGAVRARRYFFVPHHPEPGAGQPADARSEGEEGEGDLAGDSRGAVVVPSK